MEELFRRLTERESSEVLLKRINRDKALRVYAAVRFLSSLYGKKDTEKRAEQMIEKLKQLRRESHEPDGEN